MAFNRHFINSLRPCVVLTKEQVKKLSSKVKRYVFPKEDYFILQQSPARHVNHTCNPNTQVVGFSDIAIKDIRIGEEITSDYASSFAQDENMVCHCGAKNCRGIITRKKKKD